MYKLPWGFYSDSWLIDKMPDVFEIRVEEHPNGTILNPHKLTLYFGTNPMYLWGTGKMYHEVIYSQLGFMVLPIFLNRPGLEFVKHISYSLEAERDWLNNPIAPRTIGRVDIDKMTKTYLKQVYNIGELKDKELVKINDLSSKLVEATGNQLDKQYTVGYTPIYKNTSKFKSENRVISMIPMTMKNKEIIDVISNNALEYTSPFDKIYEQKGIYENVISLKTLKIDVTDELNKMFEDESGFYICLKTLPGFREGVVFDYDSTQNDNAKNYGFRLSIYRNSIVIILNSGDKFTYLDVPITLNFIVANSFVLKVEYNQGVELNINREIHRYKFPFKQPVFRDGSKGYLSGRSKSKQNVETGDLAEVGLFGFYISPSFKEKYLDMEPILPYPGIPVVKDSIVPVIENKTYSMPVNILLPSGTNSKKTTIANKQTTYKDIYLGNDNSDIKKITTTKISRNTYDSIYIPKDWNIYKVVGAPDPNFDNKTNSMFMFKKITSDIHIPLKVDISFKLPKWWTKDMKLFMSLKMIPIGKTLWYNYSKYRTGEDSFSPG